MLNKNKDELQQKALEACEQEGNILLTMATGTGKSRIAIEYAKRHNVQSIALLVPTENLRDSNWQEEFYKWDANEIWDKNTLRLCYASGSKIKGNEFDLVIMDESHNIIELSYEFFEDNICKKVIALTATSPKKLEKLNIFSKLNFRRIFSVNLDEAIELGVVSPYRITVVYTQLNDTLRYIDAGSRAKPFKTTEKNQYNYLTKMINSLQEPEMVDGVQVERYISPKEKSMMDMYIRKRMHLINSLRSKEHAAKVILKTIPEEDRYLIFAGSIQQAESLCEYRYHSKTDSKHLEMFQKGELNRLSCVEALNEGINIPDVDGSIMVQIRRSDIKLIQRIGRNIRFREGHEAHIYIIVCKDTQDEVWFNKASENLDESRIEYKSINEFLV